MMSRPVAWRGVAEAGAEALDAVTLAAAGRGRCLGLSRPRKPRRIGPGARV
jgi:hypothetical protein